MVQVLHTLLKLRKMVINCLRFARRKFGQNTRKSTAEKHHDQSRGRCPPRRLDRLRRAQARAHGRAHARAHARAPVRARARATQRDRERKF